MGVASSVPDSANVEPKYVDEEFDLNGCDLMEISSGKKWCACIVCPCIYCPMKCAMEAQKVRGILRNARRVTGSEESTLVSKFQGKWKIQPTSAHAGIQYTDCFIQGNKMVISGGMHNVTQQHDDYTTTAAVANTPQNQYLMFHEHPTHRGQYYIDAYGSLCTLIEPNNIHIETAVKGGSMILMRDMTVSSQPSAAGSSGDPAAQIASLATLKAQGLLSDSEFEAAKAKIIGGIGGDDGGLSSPW